MRIFHGNWHEPAGYIYKKESTLWFFEASSFMILNITCGYIASTLANLLCAFIVIKQSHLVFRATINGIVIIVNIYQIIVAIVVGSLYPDRVHGSDCNKVPDSPHAVLHDLHS